MEYNNILPNKCKRSLKSIFLVCMTIFFLMPFWSYSNDEDLTDSTSLKNFKEIILTMEMEENNAVRMFYPVHSNFPTKESSFTFIKFPIHKKIKKDE